MAAKTWDGTSGRYASASDWSPAGVPASGDDAKIDAGTVTVGGGDLADRLGLSVGTTGTAMPTLILQDAAIPATDIVQIGASDQSGTPASPTMTASALAAGVVTNNGSLDITRGTLAIGGTFINDGGLELQPYAAISFVSAGASLVNDGTISTFKPFEYSTPNDDYTTSLYLGVPIVGTGLIVASDGFNLEIGASVGAGQQVSFGSNATYNESQGNNVLTIDDLTTFKAAIFGWGPSEPIVATGPAYDSVLTTRTNDTTTLRFLQGGAAVDTLTFAGRFSAAEFSLSSKATGDGREQTTVTFNNAAAPAGPLRIYRYFSRTDGSQLLTTSANEAATIGTTRPDLVGESTALAAVNPGDNDPAASPVFRFFDTKSGSHFFTASTTERDTIVATRPDLTFEPNSTFLEHTTAQTGDQPVYRFFETTNGTHFYTDSTTERATIVASRPDLVAEGVAFYAPG